MKRRNAAFIAAIIGALPGFTALPQTQVEPSWKLATARVEPRSPTSLGDHIIYAAFSGEAAAKFEVSSVTFMDKVTQVAVNGDKIVVIGSGAGPDEAITIDARSRSIASRSVALSMRVLNSRWLVSVEWYPNHLFPPQYPNDVVLVQDIQDGERRCPSKSGDEASGFSALVRAAGRPVYPAKNATECSYKNVQNDDDSVLRAYPKTFTLTPDGRLIFLASSGPERDVQLLSLVEIPLAPALRGEFNVTQQSLTGLYADLKLDKKEVLQVDHLEPVKGNAVRIVFSKGAYDTNQVVVPLRSP